MMVGPIMIQGQAYCPMCGKKANPPFDDDYHGYGGCQEYLPVPEKPKRKWTRRIADKLERPK